VDYKLTCRLAKVDKINRCSIATIRFDGAINTQEEVTSKLGGAELTIQKMDLEQKGALTVNIALGMLTRQDVEQTGTIDVMISQQGADPLPVAIQQTMKVTWTRTPAPKVSATAPTTAPAE
jgi:hypothetical protein